MFFLFSSLWFLRTTKALLFWFYLWQLKEYHIGRFLAHFQTAKGRKLFFNPLFVFKVFLLITFFPFPVFLLFALFLIYSLEAAKALLGALRKRLRKPVLTEKAFLLVFIGFLVEFGFLFLLFNYSPTILLTLFCLLVFDVLVPLIVSLIVLFLQPFTVFFRNRIIKRAKAKREGFKNLLVIGITGSYGKTSTKDFLADILSERFKVLKTKEHQNSEIGISQCILNELKPEHEIFVCEMGAYNVGGVKFLADIVKPKIGILTGINEQHMATFGSQENIIRAKYELIESLPKDGIAFFNGKNKYCRELFERASIKKRLYGEEAELAGTENIWGAMAVARELGMAEEKITRVVEKIKNKTGGFRLKKGVNGLKIIDATYSANPDGVLVHLEYLKTLRQAQGKLVIIMPCLIELGKASGEVHQRIGKKIAEVCDLAIITTQECFNCIKKEVGGKALFIENSKLIFEKIESSLRENDVVLLESRVPKQLIRLLVRDD